MKEPDEHTTTAVQPHPSPTSSDLEKRDQFRLTIVSGEEVKSRHLVGHGVLTIGRSGDSGIQIGIDPTGQGVINEDRIEWSEWYSVNSPDWKPMAWRLREVETIAQGNVITVFLRAKNDQRVRSHYHFDDFTLTTSGVVPPPPPPPPPPPEGTLGELIEQLDADVQALKAYVEGNKVQALIV